MQEVFNNIISQFKELEQKLQNPEVISDPKKLQEYSTEHSEMIPKINVINQITDVQAAIAEAKENMNDTDFAEMAKEELESLEPKLETLQKEFEVMLLPQDPNDKKNVIVEIRAGAGGDESALFAGELFRMYSRFAEKNNWKVTIISMNKIELGGFKEVIFNIEGKFVFKHLKFESGVHRVQRVPATEKSGRVHTSTATVAIMPEAEDVDISIEQKDLRIDTYRASGAGGQHVNKTESAVRITHIPSGVVAACQSERSQQQNKERAMIMLRARIYAEQQEKIQREQKENRKAQVGTGDRSEKIRTYNFPQDRITDHRIHQNWKNIPNVMDGNIEPLIESLQEELNKKLLEQASAA